MESRGSHSGADPQVLHVTGTQRQTARAAQPAAMIARGGGNPAALPAGLSATEATVADRLRVVSSNRGIFRGFSIGQCEDQADRPGDEAADRLIGKRLETPP